MELSKLLPKERVYVRTRDNWQKTSKDQLTVLCGIKILVGANAQLGEYLWLIVALWVDESPHLMSALQHF